MATVNQTRKRVAVYIGRFQPLHNGHTHVLTEAFKDYDGVIVLIGSAFKARDIKNPFSYDERRMLIRNWTTENPELTSCKNFEIMPVKDQPYNGAKWIQTVQESVNEAVKKFGFSNPEIFLTGSDRDASTWYLHIFPQWKKDLKSPVPVGQDLNATALRDKLFSSEDDITWNDIPLCTEQFLTEFISCAGPLTLR